MIKIENQLAPCGINCALCHTFQRGNCPGCRSKADTIRKSCKNCVILQCKKRTDYYCDCNDMPCKRLKALDARYRVKYNVDILKSLRDIKEKGEEVFIKEQNQNYKCPDCDNLRTMHYDYCIYCKQIKKNENYIHKRKSGI